MSTAGRKTRACANSRRITNAPGPTAGDLLGRNDHAAAIHTLEYLFRADFDMLEPCYSGLGRYDEARQLYADGSLVRRHMPIRR